MDISKSVIVITAAGTPTGLAIAEHFCALGAKVALVDANKKLLDNAYFICVQKYSLCYSFLLKDKNIESIDAIFAQIKNQLGTIDVLINYWQVCYLPNLLSDIPSKNAAIYDITTDIYAFGRCAATYMMTQGEGVIINIPCIQAENASKQELTNSNTVIRGLTISWGQELEHTNIRVGGVVTLIRHYECGEICPQLTVNYDLIDSIVYIVENDSFTSRVLEVS